MIFITAAVILMPVYPSSSAQKKEKDNFSGSLLTSCTVYQIGQDEFVLTLHGKGLASPVPEFGDDSMTITLENTRAVKPEVMNIAAMSFVQAAPLLYSFEIENLSYDRVTVTMKANAPLELVSSLQSVDGFNLRIKALEEIEPAVYGITAPEVPSGPAVVYPGTTLPFYIDTRITIELRDAELRDVLRLLMKEAERNIIIDTSFPADVLITMSLFDVRIDDVINHLMRTYDIACYDSGANTTTFGTMEGLYKLSGGRTVKTFDISYAEMSQVTAMLRNLASVQESELVADDRTHTLYVNTNPAKMIEVEELISRIDKPQGQVMIRASIFEFSESAANSVTNALNMVYDDWQRISLGGGITVNYAQDRSPSGRTVNRSRTITEELEALEQETKGRVIANPSVIALDGQSATIELTQTYTYSVVRDEAGNAIAQQQDVGPTLTFTPRIERDGYVNLELDLSTGDVLSTSTTGTPVTSDRSVTTRVRVKNGMPFVVGGLFQDNQSASVSKIPILGNLPLIGQLFTSRQSGKQRNQVVMVVTPYIIEK